MKDKTFVGGGVFSCARAKVGVVNCRALKEIFLHHQSFSYHQKKLFDLIKDTNKISKYSRIKCECVVNVNSCPFPHNLNYFCAAKKVIFTKRNILIWLRTQFLFPNIHLDWRHPGICHIWRSILDLKSVNFKHGKIWMSSLSQLHMIDLISVTIFQVIDSVISRRAKRVRYMASQYIVNVPAKKHQLQFVANIFLEYSKVNHLLWVSADHTCFLGEGMLRNRQSHPHQACDKTPGILYSYIVIWLRNIELWRKDML